MKDETKRPGNFDSHENSFPFMMQMMQKCCGENGMQYCIDMMNKMLSQEKSADIPDQVKQQGVTK